MNLFDGSKLHPSPYFQTQPRTVGDALAEIVYTLGEVHLWYGSWVEDLDYDGKIVRVGNYGMAGERWISVYEGPTEEIQPLARVCLWFYKTTGCGSDEFKAKMLREEHARGFQPTSSTSAGYRPPHGGHPHDVLVAA
jgi:hypothetical protein